MTTALYARVSSEEQAREGFSLSSQMRAGHLYAELHELGTVEEYLEPGLSGRDTNRPEFQRLVTDVKAGKVTHVIVWRMNRLHRNLRQFLETLALFEERDVTLHSVTEHVDTKSATGRLLVNILASFHAFESDKLSEDVRMGTKQKIRQGGWANHAPTGYRMVHGELQVDEDRADVVRLAFEEAARGTSIRELAKVMGVTPGAVPYILRNPVYVGFVYERLADVPKKRTVEALAASEGVYRGSHTPLVSPRLWDDVQAVRTQHSTTTKDATRHVLSGILTCSCGSPCDLHSARPNRKGPGYYRVYRCAKRRCYTVGATRVIGTLLEWFDNLQTNPAFLADNEAALGRQATATERETREERRTAAKEIERAKKREERWQTLYLDGKLSSDAYLPMAGTLEAERMEWETRLGVAEAKVAAAHAGLSDFQEQMRLFARLPRLSEVWNDLWPAEQATYCQTLLERVVMEQDGLVIHGWLTPPHKVPYLDGRRKGQNPLDAQAFRPRRFAISRAGKGT